MKNFESRFNLWLDGSLDEDERLAFEATLDEETLRAAKIWPALRSALRQSASEIPVPHPDFLNAQILRDIAREASPRPRAGLSRLVWAGAFCVLAAAALTAFFLPRGIRDISTTVVSAWSASPSVSASAFQAPGGKASVIWLDGVDYIPANERVR